MWASVGVAGLLVLCASQALAAPIASTDQATSLSAGSQVLSCADRGSVGEGLEFFTFWTTPAPTFVPRLRRSVESVFRHHPKASVAVYSDTLTQEHFSVLTEHGCNIEVKPLAIDSLFDATPLMRWRYEQVRNESYFYSHLTDGLRLAVLNKRGGVYFDTDVIFLQPVHHLRNSAGMETSMTAFNDHGPKEAIALDGHGLNGAVLIFDKNNRYIHRCMQRFVDEYSPYFWGCVGPDLLTKVWKEEFVEQSDINVLSSEAFYPSDFRLWVYPFTYFNEDLEPLPADTLQQRLGTLYNTSYAYHFWNHRSKDHEAQDSSVFSHVLNDFCMLCDERIN